MWSLTSRIDKYQKILKFYQLYQRGGLSCLAGAATGVEVLERNIPEVQSALDERKEKRQ